MKRLALILIAVAVLAPAASASRRRSTHHPAPACSFSLVPVWGNGSVSPDGLTRALVLVYGQTQECSQWAAYSPVDWITVEAAPLAAQPGAFVTVSPNAAATSRTATLIIAGVRLAITQDGAARISPPIADNLLLNGTFDRNVSSWTWFSHFPNGIGTAEWSQFDANGSPASGSMLLRDSDFLAGQAYQQLQCVRIPTGGGFYEYGAKIRTGSAQGEMAIALLTYGSTDCSGNYNGRVEHWDRPQQGVWHSWKFSRPMPGSVRSALIVLASAADTPPFETWFDDVYLREVR
ncbi:MAG TPA: BACON domain-containing carbohydrate-binding protein [Thermoanaerobaculia bacterium]|nr:BACON domain-containing carbohydrate-binding protein [Thermoanaerobaculia bacterium]